MIIDTTEPGPVAGAQRELEPSALPARSAAAAHVSRLPARMLMRANGLLRPRARTGDRHRRLVDRRSEFPGSAAADGARDAVPANTFRGATARFVAWG